MSLDGLTVLSALIQTVPTSSHIAYQMLAGPPPYDAGVAKTRSKARQRKPRYKSALVYDRTIPTWVNGALRKAVHPDPYRRYEDACEFLFDLHNTPKAFVNGRTRR